MPLLTLCLLVSCGGGGGPSAPAVIEEAPLESCVDYSTVDPNNLITYFNIYVADVLCTKGFPDYGAMNTTIDILFIEPAQADLLAGVGPDHAGYSTWYGYCNDSRIDIRVTKQYWENYTDVQRLYLMYHELGHDVHRYEHVTVDPIEIMWPSITGPLTTLNDFIAAKDRFIMRTFEDINYIQCD